MNFKYFFIATDIALQVLVTGPVPNFEFLFNHIIC